MPISSLRPLAGALLLLTVGACSSGNQKPTDPASRITFNDFEAMSGWLPYNSSLTTDKAHSGRYSVKVDSGLEFALGYNNQIGAAGASQARQLTIKGWLLQTGPKAAAAVVVQVLDAKGQNVFYDSMPMEKVLKKANKWTEFKYTFTMPGPLQPEHQLKVYLWKATAQAPAYLDDFEISWQP